MAVAEHGRALSAPCARRRSRPSAIRRLRAIRDPRSPTGSSPACSRARRRPPAPGAAPGAGAAQKVVLYEEDPADPNGKRFVGSAIWRTETMSPGPGPAARARRPCRRRSAGAQAGDDLVAPPQHRQEPAGEPYGRDHVQAAAGFSLGRHLQRSRHPDEAGRADARRAARRPRRQGDHRLLPDRACPPPRPTRNAICNCSRSAPGSTSRWSTTTTAAPSWRSRKARPATARSPKPSRRGSSSRDALASTRRRQIYPVHTRDCVRRRAQADHPRGEVIVRARRFRF